MRFYFDIRRAFLALIATSVLLLAPAVSAMTPPACCVDGGMLNDPRIAATSAHMEEHCNEMRDAAEEEAPFTMCDTDCTGSCCSIYLSVGLTFTQTSVLADTYHISHARPANDNLRSKSARFPTPPPKA